VPPAFDAVNVTVYFPADANVWVGFGSVEVVVPSPKSHDQDVAPVEASVNFTSKGATPDVGDAVKLAAGAGTGAALTVIVEVAVLVPPAFDAVNVTVYFPADENVWVGFCSVEVVVPSPKSHAHVVCVPVEVVELLVNVTSNGATPDVGDAVKLAVGAGTGAGLTVIVEVA